MPLAVVLVLIGLKYLPATADLPLARLAGIVSFGYAIFLALRLIQPEEAVYLEGWSELRASPLELFGAFGGAALSTLMMVAVVFGGVLPGASTLQLGAAFGLSLALAVLSGAIIYFGMMVRVRWNQKSVQRKDARGRMVEIAWADVVKVQGRWRGITITAADKRTLSFSPMQSGAAQLAKFAQARARRNASRTAPGAVWG